MHKNGDRDDLVWITSNDIEIGVATSFGPRIMWCSRPGEANLLAVLDDDRTLDAGDGRRYRLRGGHRLWAGPEFPELTYQPDDGRVAAVREMDTLTATARGDDFGLVKSIAITPVADAAAAVVDHTIKATASATLDIAAWAITQLRPGGTAVLPLGLPGGPIGGLQASHQIVMWPYTDPGDPSLTLGQSEVIVGPDVGASTKIGTPLHRGWLAYVLEDVVFVKQARAQGERFVDLGATGQVYADRDFVELETLSAVVPVAGDAVIQHREIWSIHDRPDCSPRDIGRALGLDGEPA